MAPVSRGSWEATIVGTEGVTAGIAAASREWRSSLIDVSGNNRLLHFRSNSSTMDLSDPSSPAVEKLLAGSVVRLAELFPNPNELKTAQRACAALARKQREANEEYGVSVAFLAAGLASWNPEANEAIASAEAEELAAEPATTHKPAYTRPSAPILLRPLELSLRQGAQNAWELKLEEDFELNDVFEHVMNADRPRIDDDKVLAHDDGTPGALADMYQHVSAACADIAEFRIEPKLFIGTFSYLKQPMVTDIDDVAAVAKSDLIAALAGDPAAVARVRTQPSEIRESQPDYAPVDSEFLVLDADSSQSYVVNAALSGRNLVVEGPPGTGKSQTIANVIASMVAHGKRVLFVAQKRAAVTAVLSRLEAVDLGHLVLDLFAATGSRRYVAEELRRVLDRQRTTGVPDVAQLHRTFGQSRDRLVLHRDALHEASRGWGVSVAELRARSAGLPQGCRLPHRLPSSIFKTWPNTGLADYASAADELHSIGALSPAWFTEPGWAPRALTTAEVVRGLTDRVRELSSSGLPRLAALLGDIARAAGQPVPNGWRESDALLAFVAEVRAVARVMPQSLTVTMSPEDVETLLVATGRDYRKTSPLRLGWSAKRAAVRRARQLAPGLGKRDLHSWLLRAKRVRESWRGSNAPTRPAEAEAASSLVRQLRTELAGIQPATQLLNLVDLPFAELAATLVKLGGQESRGRMPRAYELERTLSNAGLSPVLATVRGDLLAGKALPCTVGELIQWVAVRSVLEDAEIGDDRLAGLRGVDLEAAVASFQETDTARLTANAARVRRIAAENLKVALDSYPEEHAIVRTEVTRKRNFRAVRRLFQEAPNAVLGAKPVWAMSPLQVSRLLPAEACFDVVIFDEASQVKPADAIPSLLRAEQAIIAGDSRQLPPTEFFAKVLEDTVGSANGDELDALAEAEFGDLGQESPARRPSRPAESFTRDAESILFAMDRVLAGQSRRLLWHYRSTDERLIAVSNAGIYDHSLTTFPAAETKGTLSHVTVPWSPGIRNGTNSPEAEVARVVELVKEHVKGRPDESLGVIAFGVAHQRRLEVALEEAARDDPTLRAAVYEDRSEPFFVKSIERVQGDERDAIILTVGYGKKEDGKLRYFWGPLLQEGGERRLNVAISRARRRMTLVTSFTADDVPDDAHPSPGFRLMHQFLRFMSSGGAEITGGPNRVLPLNPFEIDIRDRLVAAGLQLDPQVGVGSYRIDFAVRHPELPGRHVLAIEADGASYHSGHIARERDRLRQVLLEARGWKFHRIWSTDWFSDPGREVERVLATYHEVLAREEQLMPAESVARSEEHWMVRPLAPAIPRPEIYPGRPIVEYSRDELVQLVRSVRSDGVLRPADEELQLCVKELGFSKRGKRIVSALTEAQQLADGG